MPALADVQTADKAIGSVADVVREHAAYVGRSLRYLGVPEADVEDAAQEVFVVVHRQLGGFEGRSRLTTWLYGICVKVASARRRRIATRGERVMESPPESAVGPEQDAHVQRSEARRRLLAVLDRLDDDKRAVFVLYEIERQSMQDIADALQCPLQTAYYRLHAARKAVLEAMTGQEGSE